MNDIATGLAAGPRICIVGAGPCGITTVKNMLAAGLRNIVCYDERDALGGNWVFRDAPDQGSVYEATRIISSRTLSEFEDYPMPPDYPDFPDHRQMRGYFDDYAHHFGVPAFVRLQTRVDRATRRSDGCWAVRLSGPEGDREEVFDHLVVCSGHHRDPRVPNYPGRFDGVSLHSIEFKRADPFRGKHVLVVGGGNSGCDIAFEISRVAARTCLSMRRGYNILPKTLFGEPIDKLYSWVHRLPRPILRPLIGSILLLALGPRRRYGLPPLQGTPLAMHPTLNTNILRALRDRSVAPRGDITRLDGDFVAFGDGRRERFDVIVWATGFRMTFPFLEPGIADWNAENCPPLYLKSLHREVANLFFVGLFQPLGCIWRLADHQARIAALQIAGRLDRPADIVARIDREMRATQRRFDQTPRHAIEVDYHEFRAELLAVLDRVKPALEPLST